MAAIVAAAAALASGAPGAYATPPTLPCDYECLWPIGSYTAPPWESAADGQFTIEYTYSWTEDESDPKVGTLADKALPAGYHAPPAGQEPAPGHVYVGSTVTLELPEDIVVVDWEKGGFERSVLWTDANGHETHGYTRLNAYSPGAPMSGRITLEVQSGIKYRDAEVVVDLGVRGNDASMPLHLVVNQRGTSVVISEYEPSAMGQGSDGDKGRLTSVLPESTVSPVRTWEMQASELAGIAAFLGERAAAGEDIAVGEVPAFAQQSVRDGIARRSVDTGASGSTGTPGMAYVYGYLKAVGRNMAVVAAADVGVCLHDEGSVGTASFPLRRGEKDVCGRTTDEGFYGLMVPTTDPNDSGTADIVVRFSLVDDDVVTVRGGGAVPNLELPTRDDIVGPLVGMGTATVPARNPFGYALAAYTDIQTAHRFFEENLDYDVGHVRISKGGSASYNTAINTINSSLNSLSLEAQWVKFHEYGHHVMDSVYGEIPPQAIQTCPLFHTHFTYTTDLCVWVEGWAEFVPHMILDTSYSLIGASLGTSINVENRDSVAPLADILRGHFGSGSGTEGNIISALWDLYDPGSPASSEIGDAVSSIDMVWETFTSTKERDEAYPASSIYDFRNDWHDNGFVGIDAILALNEIDPPPASSLSSLTVAAQNSEGGARSGAGRLHVKVGDRIYVSLELKQANVGDAPTIKFAGGEVTAMTKIGDSGKLWAHAHTVPASAPSGPAQFTVVDADITGRVSFSEHAITAGDNVTIDVTAPVAPMARFSSSNEISLTFDGPLDTTSASSAQFLIRPPSGATYTVTGLYDNVQRTIRLMLQAHAEVGDVYTVEVPAITDIVGNTGDASSVMPTLGTDTAPPVFTAEYGRVRTAIGENIIITFNENVRPTRNHSINHVDWTFTPLLSSTPVEHAAYSAGIDYANRFYIAFVSRVGGTLTYSPPAGASTLEDMAGNSLPVGSSTTVAVERTLLLSALTRNDETVIVSFGAPLTGKTNASEWNIGGVPATGVSTSRSVYVPAHIDDDVTIAHPGTLPHAIIIGHAAPAGSPGRLSVEYTKPPAMDGGAANALSTGTRALQSFSTVAIDDVRPQFTSAAFTRPNTITLASSETLDRESILASAFEADGLGELVQAYVEGSATVTLTSAVAAAANTPYTITIPRTATDPSGREFENLEVVLSRSDTTPPTALGAYVARDPDYVVLELSEPLRPDTVNAEAFGVTAAGSMGSSLRASDAVSYEPLSRFVYLRLAAAPADGTTYTISIAANKARDVAGNLLQAGTQAVTYRPAPASSAAFDDQGTIVVTLGSPIRPHRIVAATFSTSPGLGQVSALYAEGSTELRLATERGASGDTEYRITADRTLRDMRNFAVSFPRVTYTDTHAPEPVSATSISPTMTEVTFGEPVKFGAADTPTLRGAHWTVNDGTNRPVSDVTLKPGETSVLVIKHARLSGTASTPTVTYSAGIDDAGRVRDTGATPNVQGGGPFPVKAADAIPPMASALTLSASKLGTPRTDNEYVRAGDTIGVSLTLGEPASAPPRMAVYGNAVDMALAQGSDRTRWSAAYTVPAGAVQGAVEFGIVAHDAGGAEATIERAAVTGGNAIIDTQPPMFRASILGQTETLVSFVEPVSGTIRASDWIVGGTRATTVAAVQGGEASATLVIPEPTVMGMQQSFVLVHAPLDDTVGTTSVAYSPPANA